MWSHNCLADFIIRPMAIICGCIVYSLSKLTITIYGNSNKIRVAPLYVCVCVCVKLADVVLVKSEILSGYCSESVDQLDPDPLTMWLYMNSVDIISTKVFMALM